MIDTGNRLLPGIEHRPTELGRIRLGDKSVTAKGKEYPVKLETWRLTSGNPQLLEAAAAIYGGTVEPWTDGPNEGFHELLTESNALQVLIPRDLRTLTQSYEWWQGGTCERRCDGTTEQISGLACLCKAEGTMECRPRTRLNIMLPDVPGLGVWRLETDGWNAATSLPATIEMLLALSVQPWVKAVLRLEQRSAKKRQADGKVITHRFAVPVLDTPNDLTLGRIVGQRMREEQVQQLPESVPQTAAASLAAQRAQLEAETTSGRSHGAAPAGPGVTGVAQGSDDPPHPAESVGDGADGPAPSPGQDDPGSYAGARTATQGTPGSADVGEPEPASHDGSGPSPIDPEPSPSVDPGGTPPASGAAGQPKCDVFDDTKDGYGQCQREAGHTGHHRNSEKESWA